MITDERDESVTVKHLEDLDCFANCMEHLLNQEMLECDQTKALLHARNQELQGSYALLANLEQHVVDLQEEITQKNAQIAALQAQLNPPPPKIESDDEDDSSDDEDDDEGGDGGGATNGAEQEDEEEEEPEEVIYESTSDEDYTPQSGSTGGKKRKGVKSLDSDKRTKN
jgi:hypothetical protein